jgi:hypothetical protein
MPSAYDLYTFYLEPDHLRGRSVPVVVEQAIVEEVFNPRIKRDEPRIVLRFHGKKLGLCCNKTQAAAMIDITGTDDFARWVGHTITLTPSRIDRERQTITITPAQAPAPEPAAQPMGEPEDDGAGGEEEEDTGS